MDDNNLCTKCSRAIIHIGFSELTCGKLGGKAECSVCGEFSRGTPSVAQGVPAHNGKRAYDGWADEDL